METNSGIPISAQMHLAALSGNAAFDYYSIEALYGRNGNKIVPLVGHLDDIRRMNKILQSDPVDLLPRRMVTDCLYTIGKALMEVRVLPTAEYHLPYLSDIARYQYSA